MNIIEFLFAILSKFAPMTDTRNAQLRMEATQWYNSVILGQVYDEKGVSTGETKEPTNSIIITVKPHLEAWYTKTGLALFFLYAVRVVSDWMNGSPDEDDDNL